MDSAPPATATSACPVMMRSAAMAMDCNPEAQNRLTVIAAVLTGRPARSVAMRAMFIPCSASGMAQPMMTSSTSFGSRPFARATASRIANAARSSGRIARSIPRGAFPIAVRTELTITASRMAHLGRDGTLRRSKPSPLNATRKKNATTRDRGDAPEPCGHGRPNRR